MSYGQHLNGWRDEWDASEELQYQFHSPQEFINRRLRDAWKADPDLRDQFRDDYFAFSAAAKKEGVDLLSAAAERAKREAQKTGRDTGSKPNSVSRFVDVLLSRK